MEFKIIITIIMLLYTQINKLFIKVHNKTIIIIIMLINNSIIIGISKYFV